VVPGDLSDAALPFMAAQRRQVGNANAVIARLSLTGELGYEINVPAASLRGVWHDLVTLGREHGLRLVGMRAQDCLRLEKGYGIWSYEFSASNTPSQCGLGRYVDYDKPGFIGRGAALADREAPPADRLVLLALAQGLDADVGGYEPVRANGERVGYITSGAYGHHLGRSLALAYVARAALDSRASLSVDLIGTPVTADVMQVSPYDPIGSRLRG
jgi:dimethylglycine dehydrogenase